MTTDEAVFTLSGVHTSQLNRSIKVLGCVGGVTRRLTPVARGLVKGADARRRSLRPSNWKALGQQTFFASSCRYLATK